MGRFNAVMASLLLIPMALAGCSATSDATKASAAGDAAGGTSADSMGGSAMVGTDPGGQGGQGGSAYGQDGRDAYGRANPREYVAIVNIEDIHFDFDSYDIRPEAAKALETSAEWLKSNPKHLVLIEGHADERGTNEYNIALGDRRARAAMNFLVSHGVHTRRISRISYGEERALCPGHDEACWAKNRRAHFSIKAQ